MVGKSFPQHQEAASLAQPTPVGASIINDTSSTPDSDAVDEALVTPSQPNPNVIKSWSFPLIALLACTMTGGTAAIAFLSLTALPPETDCTQSAAIDTDRGLLYCVQQAAQSGEMDKVLEGLEILGQWTTTDPLYYEAQSSIKKWSQAVLTTARQKLRNNQLDEAIALVKKVPQSSPLYDDAQGLLRGWQSQADQAQAIVATAQEALKQKNWDQVSEQIRALGELTAYAERLPTIRHLSAQLRTEKENNAIVQSILQIAEANTPQAIGLALEQAGTIDQSTYVWAAAQTDLEPLAKRLLSYGGLQWQQGHLDNAITTAQRVAIFERLAPEARNLETLIQARKLAIATVTNWEPSHEHLFNLLEATAAVRQIPVSSQFYAQAQDSLKSWESQFSDVSHLQLAKMSAQLGWAPTIEWASNQAKQLSPDRPRRVQAQTLAAHWNLELERIKDRRYLIWANKLAEPGTRASLKMAITEAAKVQSDRPLFGEAQGLIYSWTRDVQAQEDQPYLTLAESLARQGELQEAIKTAALIQPNRPLHNAARAAINQWQQDIWAQRRAEQQRLARHSPVRQRVVQPVVTPVATPKATPTSNPIPQRAVANPSAPSRPVPTKPASSPLPSETLEASEASEAVPSATVTSSPANPSATLDNLVTPISSPVIVSPPAESTVQPISQPEGVEQENTPIADPASPNPITSTPEPVASGESTNAPVPQAIPVNPSVPAPAPVEPPTPLPEPVAPAPVVAPAPAPVVAPAPATVIPDGSASAPNTSISLNSSSDAEAGNNNNAVESTTP